MKISSIQNYPIKRYNQAISFDGNHNREEMKRVNDWIRDDLLENANRIEQLYDGYLLSEYEMGKMIKEFVPPAVREGKKLSDVDLDNLAQSHIYPLDCAPNSYRGPAACFTESLKERLGLNKIIYKPLGHNDISSEIFTPRNKLEDWQIESLNQELDDFVDFIKSMQEGSVYVCCDFGQASTNFTLYVNNLFNPLIVEPEYVRSPYNKLLTKENLLILLDNLQPHHKQAMGWTEEFEINLRKKLKYNKTRIEDILID